MTTPDPNPKWWTGLRTYMLAVAVLVSIDVVALIGMLKAPSPLMLAVAGALMLSTLAAIIGGKAWASKMDVAALVARVRGGGE